MKIDFSEFPEKPAPVSKTEVKKRFSQIGPAVPEEIGHKTQASKQHRVAIYNRDN